MADDLDPQDAKLVTLARSARARISAPSGAAVRDETGRTYAGADVALPGLTVSALVLALAQAAAAGAQAVEAAAVVGGAPSGADMTALRGLGGRGIVVLSCAADGSVQDRLTS